MDISHYTPKSKEIIFHNLPISGDLYRYLTQEDVLVLLNRLPLAEYKHLKSVTFKTCAGADAYGLVFLKRIKGIVICDQSQRTSIRTNSAKRGRLDEFGALPHIKWPTVAIRRYLLYGTFLHELRHTQIISPAKKITRDKIPLEKLAEEYADHWRGELYKESFDHPDPVHNLPSDEEKKRLKEYWPSAMKYLQEGVRYYGREEYSPALSAYRQSVKFMEQYHGESTLVNRDVKKIQETIRSLEYRSSSISLSTTRNEQIYQQAITTLMETFGAKYIDKYQMFASHESTNLEIEGISFIIEIVPNAVVIYAGHRSSHDFSDQAIELIRRIREVV